MNTAESIEWLKKLAYISLQAGEEILKVYDSDFAVESKDDRSPLTLADKKAHLAIAAGLENGPYPILSEEGKEIPFEDRKNWERFWMVDPLDGTKEFIKRNGEFTVNIALIDDGEPILGVIYVPVKGICYLGAKELGAFKIMDLPGLSESEFESALNERNKLPRKIDRPYTIVGSRSHMSDETLEFMEACKEDYPKLEVISVGSSLKLCMVAEGLADAYPRFAPTMEWDTAAGQAIVEAAGGEVIDWESKSKMRYNREVLRNNWFLAQA